jgi:type II secretory pathway pseudopilin PulG
MEDGAAKAWRPILMLPRRDTRPAAPPPQGERSAQGERSGEAGYSLIELMVVAALLVVVLGAILALAEATQRIAPKESERAHVIREAEVGLHRMTRELRQTYGSAPVMTGATTVSGNLVGPVFQATVLGTGGTTRTVSYECNHAHPTNAAWTQCRRYTIVGVTKSGGEVVVNRVLNGSSVFTFTSPDYVRAAVEVAAAGDRRDGYAHRIVLDDGFYIRNLDPGV